MELTTSSVALAVQAISKERKKIDIVTGPQRRSSPASSAAPTASIGPMTPTRSRSAPAARGQAGRRQLVLPDRRFAFGYSLEEKHRQLCQGRTAAPSSSRPPSACNHRFFLLPAAGPVLGSQGESVLPMPVSTPRTPSSRRRVRHRPGRATPGGPALHAGRGPRSRPRCGAGLPLTEGFYWNRDEETPSSASASWSAARQNALIWFMPAPTRPLLQYLKAIESRNRRDGSCRQRAARASGRRTSFAKNGTVAPNGRMIHDMYLLEVKKPDESKEPWDYFKVLATIPGKEAFIDPAQSGCESGSPDRQDDDRPPCLWRMERRGWYCPPAGSAATSAASPPSRTSTSISIMPACMR